jgi:site-specific recombinase XerD
MILREGEKKCQICGEPLQAMIVTNDKVLFLCDKEECLEASGRKGFMRYVAQGREHCSDPACRKPVRPGWYPKHQVRFYCSRDCRRGYWRSVYTARQTIARPCAYCGKLVPRFPSSRNRNDRYFCCNEHLGLYRKAGTTKAKAGRWSSTLSRFMEFASQRYKPRGQTQWRFNISTFFQFLNLQGITSLRRVNPTTISALLKWYSDQGHSNGTTNGLLKAVSTFFVWAESEGRIRRGSNPVTYRLHRVRAPVCSPRPYRNDEIDLHWSILEQRGTALEKLTYAIGLECGLRNSEVCSIRLADVNVARQRIFVRIPNKTDRPRWVPFHERTKRYLPEWLKERDPRCRHDLLLHTCRLTPMSPEALLRKLKRVFEGTKRKTPAGPIASGFEFHRLRHSFSTRLSNNGVDTATLMAMAGWTSVATVPIYVEVLDATKENQYFAAMKRINEGKALPEPMRAVVSLEEYAAENSVAANPAE